MVMELLREFKYVPSLYHPSKTHWPPTIPSSAIIGLGAGAEAENVDPLSYHPELLRGITESTAR